MTGYPSQLSDMPHDSLTRGHVMAGLVRSGRCHHCVAGHHVTCWVAVCRGCGCHRVPMVGWPANGAVLG